MARCREEDQGDARHQRARRRGHDLPGGLARGRHPEESAHQIQRESHLCQLMNSRGFYGGWRVE